MIIFSRFDPSGEVLSVIRTMETRSKKRILALISVQISTSILELAAIATIGVIGLLSISGVGSRTESNKVNFVLELLRLQNKNLQFQVVAMSLLFILILISKTVLVMVTSRKILNILISETTRASNQLLELTLNSSAKKIDLESKNHLNYQVNDAVDRTFLSLIANICNLVSDTFMLIAVFLLMMIVDVKTTIFAGFYFGTLGWFVLKRQQKIAQESGRAAMELKLQIADKTFESFRIKRELSLKGLISEYVDSMGKTKAELNATNAKIIFLPVETRYFMEFSIILGAVLVSGLQFLQRDIAHAFGGIAIFLAAASRTVPAILRVQNEIVTIKAVQRAVSETLRLIPIANEKFREIVTDSELIPTGFDVKFERVSFKYESNSPEILKSISFAIPENDYVAITGESGEGKSTLIDLILGEVEANSGRVHIGGLPSKLVCTQARGEIAFVPQKVQLINGNVYQNISMKENPSEDDKKRVESLLAEVNLLEDLCSLRDGLVTNLGDQGSTVSVGQQQRIGIARALYTGPRLLIMDEATSALDEGNEQAINSILSRLKGSLTIIVIAHRPTSIANANREFRISQGKITQVVSSRTD
jgi:ABC-type multidrug transport system fused ATPase/permease subunit